MQTRGALCGESAAVEIGEAPLQATFLGDFVDLPMPTFVWADAAEEAGGFQVCEMLFNGFRDIPNLLARDAEVREPSFDSIFRIISLLFGFFPARAE